MPGARTLVAAAVALLGFSVAGCDSGGGFTDLHRTGAGFYGVNFDEQGAREFAGADVGRLLSRLAPTTLRWPGGEDANYFDWRTEPGSAPDAATRALQDLAAAYRTTGATPIFVLNVLAAANRVDTRDQLAMLTAAHRLGLPIKYVELGNELYAGGEFAQAFPSGAAYGRTVARYVRALHAAFPGVEVAADACLQPANARQQSWNAGLLSTATGTGAPDALTLHDYPGLVIHPFNRADLSALFANAYQAVDQLDAVIRSLDGRPVWLTEYNFHGPYQQNSPNPVQTSYARELYLAAFALLLPRIPHLALADVWTALDGPAFGAWVNPPNPQLSPAGQAVQLVDAAAMGAQSSAPVRFSDVPTLPGGYPAVVGQRFTGAVRRTSALLVNLSGTRQQVAVGSDVPAGAQYRQVSGEPIAQQKFARALPTGTVTRPALSLPPYSITLINGTTG